MNNPRSLASAHRFRLRSLAGSAILTAIWAFLRRIDRRRSSANVDTAAVSTARS